MKWLPSLLAATLFGVFVVAGIAASDMPLKAQRVPIVVATVGALLSLAQVLVEVRRARKVESAQAVDQGSRVPLAMVQWAASLLGVVVGTWLLGAVVALPLFVFVFIVLVARRGVPASIGHAVAAFVLLYAVFEVALGIQFPAGVIWG
jgi:hypothetical protein